MTVARTLRDHTRERASPPASADVYVHFRLPGDAAEQRGYHSLMPPRPRADKRSVARNANVMNPGSIRNLALFPTLLATLLALTGCTSSSSPSNTMKLLTRGPSPLGPGAATETDLAPWLIDAPTVAFAGQLENFFVAGQTGAYVTWSLHPAGRWTGAEVDVRPCAADAERLRDQRVLIHGQLIERPYPHLPLIVARRITPAPPAQHGADVTIARR